MKNAIHVGISGFPFGSASIYNCLSKYKGLSEIGINVKIINHRAVHEKSIPFKLEKKAIFNDMEYVYTSISPYKSSSFIVRRISNFMGRINEFFLLLKMGFKRKIDLMIYYPDGSFFELVYYSFLSKLFRYPIITHYVEYRSEFAVRKKFFKQKNDKLFDKYFMRFVDGVLPISDYLIEIIKQSPYKKPYIKYPPVTEFKVFEIKKNNASANYFLYVASAVYTSALKKVLSAFEQLGDNDYLLDLVINGNAKQLKKINKIIGRNKKASQINLYTKLKYSDLVEKYINANAFLIPLSNTIRDTARFPYKICEYVASGNPVITTNFGEIKAYFKDNVNALIADEYDIDQIAEKMKFVIENPEEAKKIGTEGKNIGLKYFNYNSYNSQMAEFLEKIL